VARDVIGVVDPLGHIRVGALTLSIQHPHTGQEIRFEAPYPADFEQALSQLRQLAEIRGTAC